jgi:hypothetical protein
MTVHLPYEALLESLPGTDNRRGACRKETEEYAAVWFHGVVNLDGKSRNLKEGRLIVLHA